MAQLKLNQQFAQQLRDPYHDLSQVDLFKVLPRDGSLERLSELVYAKTFAQGEILFETGKIQSSVFVFVEGYVVGTRTAGNAFEGSQRVLLCDRFTTFGAESLVEPAPAELTLTATSDGFVWILDSASFDQFALEFSTAALHFQSQISRNLLRQIKKAQETLRLYQALLEGT